MKSERKRLKKRIQLKDIKNPYAKAIVKVFDYYGCTFRSFAEGVTQFINSLNPKKDKLNYFHRSMKAHAKKKKSEQKGVNI